ncbi:translation initiation factor IF-2 [Ctenopharyngodon idella]|uniref:translation initiation factor IF-2 n=1 Tax=Ctenopharyngodon idella TaxID=7959 RepID=UPI00222F5A31|nr:translation initiation factor IF-2 [Ctenopharyngodon idella]
MKFPAMLLGFVLVCSLGIAGYIHTRRKQELQLNKQASFLDIKFRVTRDVLGEYQDQLIQSNAQIENTKKEMDTLTKDLSQVKTVVEQKKSDAAACNGDKKRFTDEIAASETEKKHIQDEMVKEKSQWETEVASLKKQLEQQSTLCKYIDKTSEEGKKLCNIIDEPQKPEAKPNEPAANEAKAEQPKPEGKKAEAPNAEAPNAEQPKVNAV